MGGHWQEFHPDARMNWSYSSDMMNESNANLEYVNDMCPMQYIAYMLVTCFGQDEQNASEK